MRLPGTPLSVFATLSALILPAGAGLTAPVWLMVMGVKLDKAAEVGSNIVGVTILACCALMAAYWLLLRPRIKAAEAARPEDGALAPEDTAARDRFVHALVWALFVVPFVLVIVSFILAQLEAL